jgi:hypothetical protein
LNVGFIRQIVMSDIQVPVSVPVPASSDSGRIQRAAADNSDSEQHQWQRQRSGARHDLAPAQSCVIASHPTLTLSNNLPSDEFGWVGGFSFFDF